MKLLIFLFTGLILFILFIFIFTACSKVELKQPTCKRVYCLSDRYTYDTVYLRTDTLRPFGRYHNDFCGSDTLKFVTQPMLFLCTDSTFEIVRYVIGDKITQPKIFKL